MAEEPDGSVAEQRIPFQRRHGRVIICFAFAIVIGLVSLQVYHYACDLGRSGTCAMNLHLVGTALRVYEMSRGAFPAAFSCDEAGAPTNSWRVRIIPFGFDYDFPKQYDFAKRWNGPENSQVYTRRGAPYRLKCPSANTGQEVAVYVAVVGPNTMWPGAVGAKRAADGSDDDKILVIEIINSNINWREPRDLTLEEALDAIQPKTGMGIGSRHRDGIHYLTAGGQVWTLDPHIDRESLRKLFVRDPKNVPDEAKPEAPK